MMTSSPQVETRRTPDYEYSVQRHDRPLNFVARPWHDEAMRIPPLLRQDVVDVSADRKIQKWACCDFLDDGDEVLS